MRHLPWLCWALRGTPSNSSVPTKSFEKLWWTHFLSCKNWIVQHLVRGYCYLNSAGEQRAKTFSLLLFLQHTQCRKCHILDTQVQLLFLAPEKHWAPQTPKSVIKHTKQGLKPIDTLCIIKLQLQFLTIPHQSLLLLQCPVSSDSESYTS